MTDAIKPNWLEGFVPVPAPPGGRFPKGVSGNPAGRPKGSLSKGDKIARALNDEGLDVVRVVLDAAKAGDMVACGHIINRLVPALRSQSEKVSFDFDPEAPITKQIEQVLAAVAAGEVPPDVGGQIISAIGTLNQARLTEELADKVAALTAKEVNR